MIVQELVAKLGLEVDEQAFSRTTAVLKGLTASLLGIGAAFGAAAVGVGALVKSAADHADKVARASAATGISTDALQELGHAAKFANLDFESLTATLGVFAKNAAGAAGGNEGLGDAFAKAGIRLRDGAGALRSVDAMLGDVAERFEAMPNGIEKTALSMQIFGRSGATMIPMLNGGRAGLAATREEARRLGVVLDETAIKAGVEFADASIRFNSALEGLRNAVGGDLIGEFAALIKALTSLITRYRSLIALPVVKLFRGVGDAARWASLNTDKLQIAAAALASILLGKVLLSLSLVNGATVAWGVASLVAGARALAAGTIAAAAAWLPLIPWALLAAAIILVADELYTFVTGGETILGEFIAYLNKFDPNGNPWIEFFKLLGALLFDITDPAKWARLGNMIRSAISPALDWIVDKARAVADWIGKMVEPLISAARFLGRGGKWLGDVAGNAVEGVAGAGKWAGDAIGGAVNGAINGDGFGGGASPETSVSTSVTNGGSTSVTNAPTFSVEQNISLPPGSDPGAVGKAGADALDDWFSGELQSAHAAVSQ